MLTPLLTPEQVADYLGVRVKTVHQLVRDGELSCIQVTHKDRRFLEEHLIEYVASRTKPRMRPVNHRQRNDVDKSASKSVGFSKKGGLKSVEDCGTDLGKEIRELCR